MRAFIKREVLAGWVLAATAAVGFAQAGEPDPATYWRVEDVRPGMKGVGRTVMVGTKLEEFRAEVLGVMRDVSPGRDMILCRLEGCKLEHSGIIQGMSGSPIYIDGKLLGAVAYAWEFAKDPIAGVTPFCQMVQYVRSNDRRLAAEAAGPALAARAEQPSWSGLLEDLAPLSGAEAVTPLPAAAGGLAGMRPIATPLAAAGFSPRALAFLAGEFAPLGMAPLAGGEVQPEVRKQEGNRPLEPGSPLSVAMVTGDFDLSAIGTVTHVEGDRVYGFGHPMMGLGACEFPMMTGYIHTVYPRASVSMKMGSPLTTVGVLDTDVSTGIAGHLGKKPDMLPVSVRVKTGHFAEPAEYHVEIVRIPSMLGSLVQAVLTNAVDTEGDLPDELTAHLIATITLRGHDPIVVRDVVSGRFNGPMGPAALFGPLASLANILHRNALEPVRIEAIDCQVDIDAGRTTAEIESVRLVSDRLQPGETLRALVTLKPHAAPRETVELKLALPANLDEGTYEAFLCDTQQSLRRRAQSEPFRADPRTLDGLLEFLQLQAEMKRSTLFLHVPTPDRGLTVEGHPLPNLPASARAVLSDPRRTSPSAIKAEIIVQADTPWVVDGNQSIKFRVVKDTELSLED